MKNFLIYVVIVALGSLLFADTDQVKKVVKEATKPAVVQATTKSVVPPIKKWEIINSPRELVGVEKINASLAHYQNMGMSKQGAAYLVGNFIQEKPSAFIDGNPCAGVMGDGGRAHGFGQWHPDRRFDMPCGFEEQLSWAVNTEMVRDTPDLKQALFDINSSPSTIAYLIKKWERYGEEGNRFYYGESILSQLSQ